jgi:hypothetical protein|tara:strand:+ start:933 stop:1673 length:741 start_codon:yes stop_codon:yes gene_type:complete
MTIRGWKTRYREIRNVFGYSKYDDLISAKKLNVKIGKKYPISNIKKTISGKTVFIIGAGPSLSRSISVLKKYQNITKIVADGAVQALIEHNIKPQILVTDLDGDIASIKKIGRTKIPIIIHAHGDNYNKLDIISEFQNKIGTTQTEKFGKLENFGGFTDGDRCVFLAENFKAKKIILFGMDFGKKIGKYSKKKVIDRKTKLKKLEYGKKLLEWIAKKSDSELYTTSESIKGFKKISLTDLEYIIDN